MERKSFSQMDCSVAQCLEVTGEWWSMLIVRDALLGVTRFDAFQKRLGIARNILQQRLENLIEAGVMERSAYCEHPPRYDYRLTQKGRDLWPVINAMRQWGDRYAAPNGPPVVLVHQSCTHEAAGVVVCSECAMPLDADNVRMVANPARVHTALR
ncbi:MAG: winged helix-turn-helix transcriptional regulator [Acidimicrobiales bacterium]